MVAAVSTALAEILGGALALNLLFGFPVKPAALLVAVMSLIGLSFLFELWQVNVDWGAAARGAVMPAFPLGAMPIIMSVLGAVVMPHNLFLHTVMGTHANTRPEQAALWIVAATVITLNLFLLISIFQPG